MDLATLRKVNWSQKWRLVAEKWSATTLLLWQTKMSSIPFSFIIHCSLSACRANSTCKIFKPKGRIILKCFFFLSAQKKVLLFFLILLFFRLLGRHIDFLPMPNLYSTLRKSVQSLELSDGNKVRNPDPQMASSILEFFKNCYGTLDSDKCLICAQVCHTHTVN